MFYKTIDLTGIIYLSQVCLCSSFYPVCHLLALVGSHHILHISRVRVSTINYIVGVIRASLVSAHDVGFLLAAGISKLWRWIFAVCNNASTSFMKSVDCLKKTQSGAFTARHRPNTDLRLFFYGGNTRSNLVLLRTRWNIYVDNVCPLWWNIICEYHACVCV